MLVGSYSVSSPVKGYIYRAFRLGVKGFPGLSRAPIGYYSKSRKVGNPIASILKSNV